MSRFYFFTSCEDEVCYSYEKNNDLLRIQFNYRNNLDNPKRTKRGDKYLITTCTIHKVRFLLDKKVNLRLNAVVSKYNLDDYKKEIMGYPRYYGKEYLFPFYNFKCILIDNKSIEINLNPNIPESKWWISETRKSKVISAYADWLPFSNYLELYFSMFVLREDLENDDDFEDFEIDLGDFEIDLEEF